MANTTHGPCTLLAAARARSADPVPCRRAHTQAVFFGAFAYFANADTIVALHAVSMAQKGHLLLGGPHRFADEPRLREGAELRQQLKASGRIHPVTLDGLIDIGVEFFWWLGPSEPLGKENGDAWPHGAFVYLYREDCKSLDCFLEVAEPQDERGSSGVGVSVSASPPSLARLARAD